MKLVNWTGLALVTIMMVVSCGETTSPSQNGKEVNQDSVVLSQEEMNQKTEALISRVMAPEDFDLQLNDGEKWHLDEMSLTKLLKLKQQIYVISGNMENYEVASYNMLGDEILEFLNSIKPLSDDRANAEYQKVLKETKNQCLFLMGSNKQEAQVAVINLSILYDEVPKIFGPLEN